MIIVKLYGGLGNQMFQYALGRRLAIENGLRLRLDLSWFATQNLRKFELIGFNIQADLATRLDIARFFPRNYYRPISTLLSSLSIHSSSKREIYKENITGVFDHKVLTGTSNRYIDGYWQSEKYFKTISQEIQKDFTLREPLSKEYLNLMAKISSENSVSIHIRRGDYVTDSNINAAHGVLPLAYYFKAIKKIESSVVSPKYYVFSDDIPWARQNLKVKNLTFIENECSDNGTVDMMLMRNCKHHIIANSSFSWWGAWLSMYSKKIVIAPSKWFTQRNVNTTDIIPAEWLVLE